MFKHSLRHDRVPSIQAQVTGLYYLSLSLFLYATLASIEVIYTIVILNAEFTIMIFRPKSHLLGDTKSRKTWKWYSGSLKTWPRPCSQGKKKKNQWIHNLPASLLPHISARKQRSNKYEWRFTNGFSWLP